MTKLKFLKSLALGGASATMLATGAFAEAFDIPRGDLASALDAYTAQTGIQLLYSSNGVSGHQTRGVKGELAANAALARILVGTGYTARQMPAGAISIVRENQQLQTAQPAQATPLRMVAAASAAAGIESVVVTSSKIKGDIQTVPIAITALSQEQLTSRQIAGGPDLVKEVPNLTFSKTNFSGYNIQIRGIGTQAISVTTDPAVAVALNDMPFIRNHFFEQEFYDVGQVEVLRGPQGTLYGRNATAGVVNVISAKPTDQFEAMLSADWGNYHNRRYEGMMNIPIVDDRADLRIAGEWTKREGYTINGLTGQNVDGRDLWSSRVTLGFKPAENLQAYLVWEHFSENDDRMRTAKQLCKTDPGPSEVGGVPVLDVSTNNAYQPINYLSQGCLPTSLYSKDAFEVPNGFSLPFYDALASGAVQTPITAQDGTEFDPYASTTQSRNLRVIETTLNPQYKAKNDTIELNADYRITPSLTFSSQTGYNNDFLWSTEDYNRFNTAPGAFLYSDPATLGLNHLGQLIPDPSGLLICTNQGSPGDFCNSVPIGTPCPELDHRFRPVCAEAGMFCDPQLGCSDRLVAQDLSDERAWQFSQEFRLASNFSGPLNFSVGGNYLHYETEENYYVFINTLTLAAYSWGHDGNEPQQNLPWVPGVSDNANCLMGGLQEPNLNLPNTLGTEGGSACMYIDPNPLNSLNNKGHNYFLSQNPYMLNSYAGFGEVYYDVAKDLKFTGGLRWTEDKKHFVDIPSELLVAGYGYPVLRVVNQQWDQLTGRAAVNWTPKLDFTDQTLVYGSYAHGYKAGGANPPGAQLLAFSSSDISQPIHPLTFKPEFIDAFELGSKNTLLDGALTLNGDIFYYVYKNYQISRIVDRTAINDNFNAHVRGAELEASWEPAPGLKFNFAGGYENATLDKGDKSIDLMDRTAGNPEWMVIKPFVTQASNCILPVYVVAATLEATYAAGGIIANQGGLEAACERTYIGHIEPISGPAGFDPVSPTATNNGAGPAPNNGEGFDKQLGGNQLPNTPHFTTSLSADYTMPMSEDWAATLHSDFYWQSQSYARVFNDRPYDKLRGYSTTNLALILTSASGWQVMGYLKNVFNATAITGDFLNSDDSGLTTNVFLTDPRLYGVRVTKNF